MYPDLKSMIDGHRRLRAAAFSPTHNPNKRADVWLPNKLYRKRCVQASLVLSTVCRTPGRDNGESLRVGTDNICRFRWLHFWIRHRVPRLTPLLLPIFLPWYFPPPFSFSSTPSPSVSSILPLSLHLLHSMYPLLQGNQWGKRYRRFQKDFQSLISEWQHFLL